MVAPINIEKIANVAHSTVSFFHTLPSNPLEVLSDYFYYLNKHYTPIQDTPKGVGIQIDEESLKNELVINKKEYLYQIHNFMLTCMKDITITLSKYYKYGYKTFNISSGLTSLLHSTDINSTYQFLKFPFNTFYINFENCPVFLNYQKDHRQIEGVYVDAENPQRVVFLGISPIDKQNPYDSNCIWVRANVDSTKNPEDLISISHFNFGSAECNPAIELAIKVLLYLNSSNVEVASNKEHQEVQTKINKAKEKKKKERLSKYLKSISSCEYLDVGRNIKINKKYIAHKEKELNSDGYHYSYKFWVRGHLRNQACGPRLSKRKLIWIKPHIKGPDGADVVHKKYHLTT